MNIGKKIRELRQARGISQETMARALSLSPQAVSRWENGNTAPDISLLPSLAHYFDVSIDVLFSYDSSQTAQNLEVFFDKYYAALQDSEETARILLQEALHRYPGEESLRLLQCFHLKAPENTAARIALCRELSQSKNPTVRTEAAAVLASSYHKLNDESGLREALSLLPECDVQKLALSADLLSGDEAMLCAQRQKNSSLATLFHVLLRICALYQSQGKTEAAQNTRRTAARILEALREDEPYQFPKGNRSADTYDRFAEEFYDQIHHSKGSAI